MLWSIGQTIFRDAVMCNVRPMALFSLQSIPYCLRQLWQRRVEDPLLLLIPTAEHLQIRVLYNGEGAISLVLNNMPTVK